jgi:hypothetical protein
MKRFDFPLVPADTMTIRRVLKPPRVPNKGRAVYRMETSLVPVLEENGWEFVSQNKKDHYCCYFRSPGGVISETFKGLANGILCYSDPRMVQRTAGRGSLKGWSSSPES